MTRIAYRIEDDSGTGPYNGKNSLILPCVSQRHPSIEDEGRVFDHCDYFGFPTMEKLSNWFDSELLVLLMGTDAEFYVSVYAVGDDFAISRTQMTYCSDTSDFVGRLPLSEVFPNGPSERYSASAVATILENVVDLEGWTQEDRGRTIVHPDEEEWADNYEKYSSVSAALTQYPEDLGLSSPVACMPGGKTLMQASRSEGWSTMIQIRSKETLNA